nr:hypothetical protein [uncultured Prevotella sp.]
MKHPTDMMYDGLEVHWPTAFIHQSPRFPYHVSQVDEVTLQASPIQSFLLASID